MCDYFVMFNKHFNSIRSALQMFFYVNFQQMKYVPWLITTSYLLFEGQISDRLSETDHRGFQSSAEDPVIKYPLEDFVKSGL